VANAKPLVALYHEGYLRLSLKDYDPTTLTGKEGRVIHLTNAAVQKKHPDFKAKKEETIWSMETFKNYTMEKYGQKSEDFEVMHQKIKKVLSASMFAAVGKIQHLQGCFELLGCDILIDDQFNPHLIEINTNPALYTDTEPQKVVIPEVVHKTLDLVLDANAAPENMEKLLTAKSADAVKGWELIYNEATDYFV